MRALVALAAIVIALGVQPAEALAPGLPPLAKSSNVQLLGNVPTGPALGMVFKDHWAFVTGPQGLTVLDIAIPADPAIVALHPLPHFENEDVDLCGNTVLIVNDRASRDLGAVLYVFDISTPSSPVLASVTPVGLTGTGRGAGHIANFVSADCSQVWLDGGDLVEVFDLSNPAVPRSLGKFESEASKSDAFRVTHDTERDSRGVLWSVGGGGAAGYQLTADPLAPRLVSSTGATAVNPSPYNDFILHNSKRNGNTLLITEEDYVDTDEVPPGGCRGQGKFETWSIGMSVGGLKPLDTWMTEMNGSDSKAAATVNCSSHWFEVSKDLVAVGWYEQGTRFLDVHNPRDIRQVGFYATTRTYTPVLSHHRFEDRVAPLRSAYARGDMQALVELAMPMVDTFAITGTEEECRERLAAFEGLVDRIVLGGAWVGPQDAVAENYRRLLDTFRPAG